MTIEARAVDYDRVWEEVYGDVQRFGPTHFHTLRLCRKLLTGISFQTVLDVGCGPGHNLNYLRQFNPQAQVSGIDISEACIHQACASLPGRYFTMDIQRDYLRETFDLVFCCYLLEHLKDDGAALKNMRRMTRKHLLISTILGNYDRYQRTERLFGHVRNYHREELENKVRKAGFQVVSSLQWGFPFYSPLFRITANIIPTYGVGKFGFHEKLAARCLRALFYLNLFHRGDVITLLASV